MPKEFFQQDIEKTQEQLLQEVAALRQRVSELEVAQSQQQRRSLLNRQRLTLVLQTSNIGIWFCDLPSLRLEWDAKCKEHFGLPVNANVTARQFLKRLQPEDRKRIRRTIRRAIQERTICDVTCRLRIPNAKVRWIRAIGSVFYDETGEPSRFDGITINVTEQKLQEEERDSLLYREQLARETAEAANRVKDEFLGVLSHELRSPLNPILGWSRLLQKRAFDPEIARRALQTIERNAKLQTQLIEDLLDISRILRGKLTLNICTVNLVDVIEAALKTVQLAAESKSIGIHTHFDPTVGNVAGDPVRLQQIVWNLLSNAIKFTAAEGWVEVKLERMKVEGGGINQAERREAEGRKQQERETQSLTEIERIEIERTETEQPDYNRPSFPLPSALCPLPSECAQITIRDTGRGISPEFLPYVFDYFRQANSSTTRKFGGLGLGLTIVRHLVELHGGTIQVSSPGEGQGATFTVFLPILKNGSDGAPVESGIQNLVGEGIQAGQPPTSTLPHSLNTLPSSLPLPLSGVRVLIVDHQRDIREVATFTLGQFGAETTVARSTTEALQAVVSNQVDLLLIDLGTPGIDGYRLMQQIRTLSLAQGGQIPAIALTDYPGEYNQQRVLEAGFQLYLPKSVDPEALVAAVMTLIKRSPAR